MIGVILDLKIWLVIKEKLVEGEIWTCEKSPKYFSTIRVRILFTKSSVVRGLLKMSQSPRWILPFPESCPLDEDDMTVWYGKEEQVEVGPPASPVDEPDSTVEEKKTEGEQPSGAEEKENEMEQEVAVVKKEDELSDEGTEKVNEKVVEVEQPAIVEKSEADKPQKDDDEDEETIPLITADDDDDDDENKENLPPYSRMVEVSCMWKQW